MKTHEFILLNAKHQYTNNGILFDKCYIMTMWYIYICQWDIITYLYKEMATTRTTKNSSARCELAWKLYIPIHTVTYRESDLIL